MIQRLRSLAKAVLQAVTAFLHPWRRARALRRLAAVQPVRSVLFLCLGNVCRSPYAEASFETMASSTDVDSAGFIGPNRNPPEDAQLIARERGLELSSHVSKVVSVDLVERNDLVVVMDPRQRARLRREVRAPATVIVLGDLDPERPGKRAIRDPWGQDPEVFRSAFERIDRCLREIVPFVAPRKTRSGAASERP
jgi:protein-tyrosine phosphatase